MFEADYIQIGGTQKVALQLSKTSAYICDLLFT